MSKWEPLWQYIANQHDSVTLSFDEIATVLGFPIDHSFLNAKKELLTYGWQTGPISLKRQTVTFTRLPRTLGQFFASLPDTTDIDVDFPRAADGPRVVTFD